MISIYRIEKSKIYFLFIALILFLGIFLRLYKLGEIPNSLNWDEASWGYNSYSILQTGKDEYGSSYPISFESFGDYKQPVYAYLGIIPTKILGLTPFSVRITSAIAGILSIIVVYFLTQEIFRKQKFRKNIAIISMFLFAISPTAVQFSRIAFDANLASFFVIFGAWLFLKSLNERNTKYLFLSIIPFALSVYTYHSSKVFTPIFVVFLLFIAIKFFDFNKKIILVFFLLFFICNIFWIMNPNTSTRGRSVTFFSNSTEILKNSVEEKNYASANNDPLGEVLNNRRIVFLSKYLENYLAHFDLNYLFLKGDNPSHHAPSLGLLYLISLPLIVVGIYFLIFNKDPSSLILTAWLMLAPVAASFAQDAPNTSRSLMFLPTWDIFAAAGIVYISGVFKNKKIILSVFAIIFLFNFVYYIHQYFNHTNTDTAPYWQYGYKEAVQYSERFKNTNRKIFYSSDIEQGYIFYLFYNKYDPAAYLSNGGSNRIREKCYSIDSSYFGTCDNKMKNGDIVITTQNNISSPSLYKTEIIKSFQSKDKEYSINIIELRQ